MLRIGLAVALALSLFAAPLLVKAQQARMYKIGVLCNPPGAYVAAFEESLRQLGYVRGGNVVFETRCRAEELPKAVADLLRLNVEVIVTGPNLFIDAAKQATTSIPIVMVYGRDPVGRGYISSLARPGGNITGLTWDPSPEIFGKHVELLAEVSPRLSRIGGIVDPSALEEASLKAAEDAAKRRGIALLYMQVRTESDLPKAFALIVGHRASAVMIFGGPYLWGFRAQIATLARKNALPTIYMYREGPDAGGLMSYGTNLTDAWRRAAIYVDKILKGAKPADLPVEQPTKFELVINLKTAKALGLTIPQSLLVRADEVIQ
ncbi:MAG TPA: ABC transporter substrate-binding protein [Myxococcaceae bacterium]|nr:ABC transporter substrate-binding protein [Myxococcaceae bacterium]